MHRIGFARPGALQMLISVLGSAACAVYPAYLAATSPEHEFGVLLSGLPALLLMLMYLLWFVLYLVGFIRYAASKGYGAFVILLLLLANILGFILLLVLPDRRANDTATSA